MGASDFGSVRFTSDDISPNVVVLYGSSKPGNRSFGRFSRPLLEVYFTGCLRHKLKVKALAVAEIFRYCKGFRLSYSFFYLLDQKYKRGLLFDILSEKKKVTSNRWSTHRIGDFLIPKSIKQLPSLEAPLMAFTATGGVCEKGERYDRGFLVKDANTKLYKRTDYGDFIYSSNNLDVGSIGLNLYGSAVISDVYEIFSIENADQWFISEAIQQKSIMRNILKYRQGCLYGQYRIYADDFLSVIIKLPPLDEQKEIGKLFSRIEAKIQHEQTVLTELERLNTSLLQQLII